jgi:hypothetical protein
MRLSAELDIEATAPALAALGVATIHEAQSRRALLNGLNLMVGPAFAGTAATVFVPAGDNLGIHAAIRDAPPAPVVCIASCGLGIFGVFGDIFQAAALARGIAGISRMAFVIWPSSRRLHPSARGPLVLAAHKSGVCFPSTGRSPSVVFWFVPVIGWLAIATASASFRVDQVRDRLAAARGRAAKEDGVRAELALGRTTVEALGLVGLLDEGEPHP